MKKTLAAGLVALAVSTVSARAQTEARAQAEEERVAAEQAGVNPPAGFLAGLAAGIGVISLGDPDISDVTLENGIVRVGKEESMKNGIWLETHFPFARGKYVERKGVDGRTTFQNRVFYQGPFVGVQVTDGTDLIKTIGVGWMISLKQKRDDPEDKGAFNLGLGVCNTQVQELDSGATEGEPLPAGQESVRLKKKNVRGGMLIFSFTFL